MMVQWERTLTMTEPEESVLVTMARYFIEHGLDRRRNRRRIRHTH